MREQTILSDDELIMAALTPEIMAGMLSEISQAVGIEMGGDTKFFVTQVPLRVKSHAKAAVMWEEECAIARRKVYGR